MINEYKPSYIGFNEHALTFRCDGVVERGMLVTMGYSGAVRKAKENEAFIGKVIATNSDFATVQVVGYIECESDKEIPVGRIKLVSDGYDCVSESDDGLEVWVINSELNEDGEHTVGFLL